MEKHALCVFKGYGNINPNWVQDFLNLFRKQKVNIRKLLLLTQMGEFSYSMVEVHFSLHEVNPTDELQMAEDNEALFLPLLKASLSDQQWTEKTFSITRHN